MEKTCEHCVLYQKNRENFDETICLVSHLSKEANNICDVPIDVFRNKINKLASDVRRLFRNKDKPLEEALLITRR